MKIYHLNCGTLCPICERLINGTGSYRKAGKLVCHCLLIESHDKLVLVDTGLGIKDVQQPHHRLGRMFTHLFRPKLDLNETAYYQIKKLGFSPQDVTDIFPTHLDLDHVGGLADFPHATIHVYHQELLTALNPSFKDQLRYRELQFSHQPKWQRYHTPHHDWFGLPAFNCSEQLGFELNMVPLVGHTLGHVGIAVKQDKQWLLHCGDAYFHRSQIGEHNTMPKALELFEKQAQSDKNKRLATLQRLKQLRHLHPEIQMFCAHDVVEFEQFT
ncbi:MAG: MBL fold metallo-hydrolase [Acinetobacter sp.]|nr:MAG: MBL fold metallo-hydrolase [Acinetobacter sp.]